MLRNNRTRFPGFLVLVLWASQIIAAPDQVTQQEIDYLLTRLETSGCQFFRNGSWYDANRARQHLERKYAWLVKRDLVATTEQFIERAATESSRSGEPYLVRCAGAAAEPSGVWLTNELEIFRNQGADN